MSTSSFLSGHFLIAMPNLLDPNFNQTVTFICEHNAQGAFGIVINRQTDTSIGEVLSQLEITATEGNPSVDSHIFLGGPVEVSRGLVLHSPVGEWAATLVKIDEIAVTSSLDIIRAIGEGEAPEKFILATGYAGWGPGQLEQEMAENAWLNGPADPKVIFETPIEDRWNAAAKLLGVDLRLLSSEVGHA